MSRLCYHLLSRGVNAKSSEGGRLSRLSTTRLINRRIATPRTACSSASSENTCALASLMRVTSPARNYFFLDVGPLISRRYRHTDTPSAFGHFSASAPCLAQRRRRRWLLIGRPASRRAWIDELLAIDAARGPSNKSHEVTSKSARALSPASFL